MDPEKQRILILADDDPDDRMMFADAIAEIHLNIGLKMANDGNELMNLLRQNESPVPEMIFLDLNMPLKNGFECLQEIRHNELWQEIFIVVYSTTASSSEIDKTFDLGANIFIKKPNTYLELMNVLRKTLTLDPKEYFINPHRSRFSFV